jgi:heme-degrading monooxygenase HmoA
MVIGEVIDDGAFRDIDSNAIREFLSIYREEIQPEIQKEPGFQRCEFLIEEGGGMILTLTVWATREDCIRYHTSRAYRQFVAKTQHLLVGDFVVKLFRLE